VQRPLESGQALRETQAGAAIRALNPSIRALNPSIRALHPLGKQGMDTDVTQLHQAKRDLAGAVPPVAAGEGGGGGGGAKRKSTAGAAEGAHAGCEACVPG
jgi:hypothetical protein